MVALNSSEHILAYALTVDLPKYGGPDLALSLPPVLQATPIYSALIEQAGQIALQSTQSPVFQATHPPSLQSIFEHIENKNQSDFSPKNWVYPIYPLDISQESGFPQSTPKGDWTQLWQGLKREFDQLLHYCAENPASFTETLVYLLKKYTSCIPLGEQGMHRATKLFEFLKTRAAIAECLYRFQLSGQQPDFPFLLLCADISGIQEFIYNIIRNKALRALKGRSFYLQQLLDTVMQGLIDHPEIKLSMAHVLYNSGGKFYALAPNLPSVIQALSEVNQDLVQLMWEKHRERLSINFDNIAFQWTPASGLRFIQNDQIQTGNISRLWEALQDKLTQRKRKPLKGLLEQQFSAFFAPIDEWINDQEKPIKRTMCAVTGELIKIDDEKKYRLNNHPDEIKKEDPIFVSETVKAHSRLGYQLKTAVFYFVPKEEKEAMDINTSLIKKPEDVVMEYYAQRGLYYLPSFRYKRIHYVNDPAHFLAEDVSKEPKGDSAYGFSFYGGNEPAFVKDKNGDPLKFIGKNDKPVLGKLQEKDTENLAGVGSEEDKHQGFKRLGILRMDVDGLGALFRQSEFPSLAVYTTLSVSLDWFFSAYINDLRAKGQTKDGLRFADWINILYSGGDDLFLYGRWDLCIEFAQQLREQFALYTCRRPGLSISAGLALIEPKFPFNQGAKWAGEALDASKDFTLYSEKKNAFTFLGQTISWKQEFTIVQNLAQKIYGLRQKNLLSNQFLYKLYEFQVMKAKGKWDWRWLSVYYFAKLRETKKGNKQLEDFITQLQEAMLSEQVELSIDDENNKQHQFRYRETAEAPGRLLDLYILAAKWAELLLREKRSIPK